MAAVPASIDTDRQPPMTIPLRHFLVGIGFLVLAGVLGTLTALAPSLGRGTLAHVHVALAGWVCITIMGAMTQFVPVWSGSHLYSRRLAVAQLWLVTIGLLGFAGVFLAAPLGWLHVFGALLVLGFWVFVYNIGRTLATVGSFDVTERHFLLALLFFVLVTGLGYLLAVDFVTPVLGALSVGRTNVVMAHATLAIFGAILTTIIGALYQLSTMFTQTELHGIDVYLRTFEELAYPVGVLALAVGRLIGDPIVATVGGLLVAGSLLGFSVVLGRRLLETRVDWTPMLARYAVAAPALAVWALLALPAWYARPLAPVTLFGAPRTVHLLVIGVIGFVVLGTLYHVVPFIIWIHRYSDRMGFEPVPMIDDLYRARLATLDFAAIVTGTVGLVLADYLRLSSLVVVGSGVIATVGFGVFVVNILLVIRDHSPQSIQAILLGESAAAPRGSTAESRPP